MTGIDLWRLVTEGFTSMVGLDIFLLILYLFGLALIYVKSQNVGTAAVYMIVAAAALFPAMGLSGRTMVSAMAVLAVGALLWQALKK